MSILDLIHFLFSEPNVLPFLELSTGGPGVETIEVGHFDDAVSQAIHITNGFPFGNKIHTLLYVSAYPKLVDAAAYILHYIP